MGRLAASVVGGVEALFSRNLWTTTLIPDGHHWDSGGRSCLR